jgi:putative regulator of septum formation
VLTAAIVIGGCQPTPEDPTPTPSVPLTATVAPSPDVSASPSAPEDGGEETGVFELKIGDCFSTDTDELQTVDVVACAEAHQYEVFALLDHPATDDEPYPGADVLLEYADGACQAPFEEYVDHAYQTSIWYITSLSPTEGTWADGDREIVCTLNRPDEAGDPVTLTGSAEGSAE